ncbi:MAG: glycosyltransferase family 4 protein [Lentimicrobiaceae bacterium]|jgi:glycosyltransferase involved in cell wall biosynthesis
MYIPKKPIILIFIAHYLPGYKSGGPVRSICNIVEALSEEFEFRIITSDRDYKESNPYVGIKPNQWQYVGNAQVFYLTPDAFNLKYIVKLLSKTAYDVLYINSFFDPITTIRLLIGRRIGLIPEKPVVLAPRGELDLGCMNLKYVKKKLYIQFAKFFGLYKEITWHASSNYEVLDIMRIMNVKPDLIQIALNIPTLAKDNEDYFVPIAQDIEGLKLIFLSRISREKNLDYALKVLSLVKAHLIFDIYGTIEDPKYWDECRELILKLPSNIKVNYRGNIIHAKVAQIFSQYDLFFFPTRGENYGHVIIESLTNGTQVLISKTTPWRNLETDRLGWDFDLASIKSFVNVIENLASQNIEQRFELRKIVKTAMLKRLNYQEILRENFSLFTRCLKNRGA